MPQVRVLSHAAAFVTHNGMNSTMEALHLCVPMIGVPQMLDSHTVDAATLRSTVDAVVADPSVRSAVDAMSGRLRAADGPATGADALEAHVAA